ncbi:flagellar hook-length control protein FliK [Bacillus sp. SLBN-46]|uniref:flagellar hook-length control protein FliK n=1 Tax=Bacillus sp. SLBN-46 TaxID=3042283 RepID=UPI0028584DB5|nr:flagellar hook-length control protein FliK [Bacillus sp. SLBN-46]MDR6123789.1 flagellar hook-length control protein FliK [Bacillus sp. SLBN-46]
MGLTQIDIKINQTNQQNGGKSKIALQSGNTGNSFEQVLAMFSCSSQTQEIGKQESELSKQKTPNPLGGSELLKPIQDEALINSTIMGGENTQGLLKVMAYDPINLEKYTAESDKYIPIFKLDTLYSLVNMNTEDVDSSQEKTQLPLVSLSGETNQSDLLNITSENDQQKPLTFSDDDWDKIDAFLTALIAGIQQMQQISEAPQNLQLDTDSPSFVTQTDSYTLSKPVEEVSNFLVQELRRGKELNVSPLEINQLLEKLNKLIEGIKEQKTIVIPTNIDEKIQIILNEMHSGVQVNLNPNQVPQQRVSLDKNQVTFSAIPIPQIGKNGHEGNRVARMTATTHSEDTTTINIPTILLNNQQKVIGNELKVETLTPNLEVSDFAPEVSEWIGRFMKVTEGKSGSTEAKFSLFPEHLGHIEIKVSSNHGQVSAQILTDTPMAKEALEGQLQHLKLALQQYGYQVQKLDVVQQTPVTVDSTQAGLSFSQDGSQSSREQRTFTSSSENGPKEQQEMAEQIEHTREVLPITYGGATQRTTSRIDFTA